MNEFRFWVVVWEQAYYVDTVRNAVMLQHALNGSSKWGTQDRARVIAVSVSDAGGR